MILLDTHVWVRWLVPGADPLPAPTLRLLAEADSVGVSAVSCWEAAYLHKRGRIQLAMPLMEWLDAALHGSGIECIALDHRIAAAAAVLTEVHRDPADRFIIATAIETRRQLVTLDTTIHRYPELAGLLA